jgi:hypothetical protein
MLLGFDPFNACSLSSIRQAAADAARLALACSRPELKSRLSVLLLYQLDRLVDSDPVRGTPNAIGTRRRRHPPAVGGGSVFRVGPSTVDRMRAAVIKLRLLPQRSGAEARWPVSAALRRSVVVPSFDRVSLGSPARPSECAAADGRRRRPLGADSSSIVRRGARNSYLVDPASSHMLVSKIKPCMSKHRPLHGEAANGSLGHP